MRDKNAARKFGALLLAPLAVHWLGACSPDQPTGNEGEEAGTGGRRSLDGELSAGVGGDPMADGSLDSGSSGGSATGGGNSEQGGSNSTGEDGSGGSASADVPFILGADITITLEDEYWGATYTEDGEEKPLEEILRDHGFNFIRIDTFVDPGAPGGYAADKEEDFRDLPHTIELAQRVKDVGMGFLLDLHMSDTWTNPSTQAIPAPWSDYTLSELEDAVYDYVYEAVNQLAEAGAQPDMVQVGNEVTNGMLWEIGRIDGNDFENFGVLLKAGISAVRAVDPDIQVMLHIEKCNDLSTSKWWIDGVLGEGVDFDVLGQSCYAAAYLDGELHHSGYQGTPSEWQTVFDALAADYPDLKFVVAEYSAEQRAANDVMRNLPDGRGLGTFNWDPTRFYETHPNVPLFEPDSAWNDYVTVPSEIGKYDQMVLDYGL